MTALLLLSLALLPAPALQDGGKIQWIGKGQDPVQSAYDQALRDAKPMVLFFCADGNAACTDLSKGAFSDPDVIRASAQLTCIFVDCSQGKNAALFSNLKLKAIPSIVFMDPTGVPLADIQHRDAPSIATGMEKLALMFSSLPRFPEDIDGGLAGARKAGRPLLVYFYDDSPASLSVSKSLNDDELKPLRERFSFARTAMQRGSAPCVKYEVDRAPTVLVLDAALAHPESKPIARITGSRNPRELRRDLDDALNAPRSAADPSAAAPSAQEPVKKEDLSDDELDRKFIRARLSIAEGLIKQTKKKEAIEVLEDVVKTYPKHVATLEAVQLLDRLRK